MLAVGHLCCVHGGWGGVSEITVGLLRSLPTLACGWAGSAEGQESGSGAWLFLDWGPGLVLVTWLPALLGRRAAGGG